MSAAAGRKYNHSTFSVLSRYQYDLGAVINLPVAFADRAEVEKEGKIASRRANNAMHPRRSLPLFIFRHLSSDDVMTAVL